MAEAKSYQQYKVLKREDGRPWELGRGGMGITYKAYDTNLRRVVALKVINRVYLSSDTARQRFLREARAAAALQHLNVASIFDLGGEPGDYFYVMEFIDGETLDAYLRRKGPLELAEAFSISLQVSRALEAAAQKQLVHRDLKPTNLMLVERQGERIVKVIDFGLAKSEKIEAEESGIFLTDNLGGLLGTPHFVSPEQIASGDVDIRSDIYSLGVTLYFMLTGKPPFFGSPGQIIAEHLYKPLPIAPLAHLPRCAVDLLKHMTDKDRDARPKTPPDLQNEILASLEQVSLMADANSSPDQAPTVDLGAHRAPELIVGEMIGENYRLVEELCASTEGTRFLAEDLRLSRRVNFLTLSGQFLSHTPRLTALKQSVEQLHHASPPSPREVYLCESVGTCSFIVEEYAVGPSLLELLRSRSALKAPEVMCLLSLLAPLADHARQYKLPYVDFTLGSVQLIGGNPTEGAIQSDLLHLPLTAWEHLALKVNAIDFSLLAPDANIRAGPAALTGSVQKNGERDSYLRLLSLLAYELLGGPREKVETAGIYTPIAALTEEGNAVLRR